MGYVSKCLALSKIGTGWAKASSRLPIRTARAAKDKALFEWLRSIICFAKLIQPAKQFYKCPLIN